MRYVVGMRKGGRPLLVLLVTVLTCARLSAQTTVELPNIDEVPPEIEQTLRELVERFEQTRDLLREQILLNEQLFTQAEVDALVVDIRATAAAIAEENQALRQELKRLGVVAKNESDRARDFKNELIKVQLAAAASVQALQATLDAVEDETLLQLGPVFSPSGSLGMFGIVNLPASPVGLYSQFDYQVQTQQTKFGFGISFALVPQGSLIALWQRVFSRGDRGQAPEAATTPAESQAQPQDSAATPVDPEASSPEADTDPAVPPPADSGDLPAPETEPVETSS